MSKLGSNNIGEPGGRRESKKLRYSKLCDDWGEQLMVEGEQTNLGSSREEVGACDLTLPTLSKPWRGGSLKRRLFWPPQSTSEGREDGNQPANGGVFGT